MRHRTLATLALASMLVLAGCSFGGTGTPTASPTDATSVDGDGTPSPTDTPAGQSFSYPDGYAESGVTNATAAVESHRAAVLATSGFAVDYDATVTTPNRTTLVTFDQRVETESREVFRRTNVTSGEVTGLVVRYYDNDTVYVKSRQPGQNTTYSNQSQSYQLRSFTGVTFLRPAVANVSYAESEVTTRNGARVVVYSDATLESATALFGSGVRAENVTDFSATLVLGEDGIVREVSYSATVDRGDSERQVEVTVRTTGIGSTTVDRPPWVSRA